MCAPRQLPAKWEQWHCRCRHAPASSVVMATDEQIQTCPGRMARRLLRHGKFWLTKPTHEKLGGYDYLENHDMDKTLFKRSNLIKPILATTKRLLLHAILQNPINLISILLKMRTLTNNMRTVRFSRFECTDWPKLKWMANESRAAVPGHHNYRLLLPPFTSS